MTCLDTETTYINIITAAQRAIFCIKKGFLLYRATITSTSTYLATRVDRRDVVIAQRVEFARDGGDLFDAFLVRAQIAFKRLMSFAERLRETV